MTSDTVPERLIRLEGKLDAYAAGQSARLDAIDQRLNRHETQITDLQSSRISAPVSGWKVAGVVLAAIVAMVVVGNGVLSLIQSTGM